MTKQTDSKTKVENLGKIANEGTIPNLRFPEFNGEWKIRKLGEIVDFKVTNSFSRENLNCENGTVKNIHYGDIHTKFQTLFDITKEQVPFINQNISIGKIVEDNYCKEGDVIFADASEDLKDVGKSIEIVNLNDEKLLSGLHTILARPKANMFCKGFNGYLFQSHTVRLKIQKEAQGTKVLSLSSGRISNINLSFPALQEQEKIADFLSLIDARSQLSKKIINRHETEMRIIREKIFNQQMRFTREKTQWKELKLDDFTDIRKGEQLNKEDLTEKGIYPCLNGGVNFSGYTDKYNTNANTITISEGGNSCGYVNFLTSNFWLGGHCYKIVPKSTINLIYFYHLLKFNEDKIMKLRVGSGLPNIQQKDLRNFKVSITVSLEEQTKIANFLTSLDAKIETEKQLFEQYKQQKAYLLQNLFI